MSSLEEDLSRLNNQYQDEIRKCNIKYDELVREYRKNQPNRKGNRLFSGEWKELLTAGLSVGYVAFIGTCTISCFTNCDDWWSPNCDLDTVWMDSWFQLHVIIPTVIIMGIAFLFELFLEICNAKTYRHVEVSIDELERERKRELDKLQKDHDADKQQIITQYNQKRDVYLKQLRNSKNTLKLKEQVFLDFEKAYKMTDKSAHIKEIIFGFCIIVNQEDIRISATQGQSRFHDMGYTYKRMQMKNLENIQISEALAAVISEEVNFMIKEHYKQAVTDVKCNGTVVQIVFVEPNMNYRGLEAW